MYSYWEKIFAININNWIFLFISYHYKLNLAIRMTSFCHHIIDFLHRDPISLIASYKISALHLCTFIYNLWKIDFYNLIFGY